MPPRRKDSALVSRVPRATRRTTLLLAPPPGRNGDETISALNNSIQVITLVKDLVPIEVAKGAFSTILSVLTTVKTTISNQNDFQDIAAQCQKIGLLVWRATVDTPDHSISPSMHRALSDLQDSVATIRHAVDDKAQKNIGSTIFNAQINQDTIASWKAALDRFLTVFNTELNISANLKLDELQASFEEFKSTVLVVNQNSPESDDLPPPPSVFVGRDELAQETVQPLLSCNSVALIGPGGMGKTTVARAVINNDAIASKFGSRRYFVRFDNVDASQITYGIFLDRIARSLGIKVLANVQGVISKALSVGDIFLVLDNAETFLDAAVDSGRIAEAIDEFGARANVAIMLTTRTTVLPPNVDWMRIRVPALEESAAAQAFRLLYRPPIEPSVLDKLLSAVDYHPLSINLLAQAAAQNEWTPEDLMSSWDGQRAKLLENGGGKIQSLTVTIETSIKSPSVTKLGNTIQNLLQVIAILPQGLNKTYLTEMFPTISDVKSCAEALCKHSLAYQKKDYITLLAPIRLYIMENYNKDPSSIPLFDDVLDFYFSHAGDDKVVTQDDVNIEHLTIISLRNPAKTVKAVDLVQKFGYTILEYKPRPIMLHKSIIPLDPDRYSPPSSFERLKRFFNLYDSESPLLAKGRSLVTIATLLRWVGQPEEGDEAWNAARAIFLRCGSSGRINLAFALYTIGLLHFEQGNFIVAEEYLKSALKHRSRSLVGLLDQRQMSSLVNLGLGNVAVLRGRLDGAKTILSALPGLKKIDDYFPPVCLISAANVELWVHGRYEDAEKHLKQAESMSAKLDEVEVHLSVLLSLGEVAELRGDTSQAEAYRSKVGDIIKGLPESKIVYVNEATTILSGYIANVGDIDRARGMIAPVITRVSQPGMLSVLRVKCLYAAGCIELRARNLEKAKEYFQDAIDHSVLLSELHFRARSERALGEVALLERDFADAKKRFSRTRALCETMGMPTHCLYYDYSCHKLDDFNGWALFLQDKLME